jgi:predicted component of type VI protein secretion system
MDANLITQKIHTTETLLEVELDTSHPPPKVPLQSWISLHLIESGQILPLPDRTEFTLGRSAEGQPIVPDVDLAPYNAYVNGVSRLHAAIKRVISRIVVVDLGSSNGTYLNGTRLTPYVEMPVVHGDLVYLGKLKIQVLIN